MHVPRVGAQARCAGLGRAGVTAVSGKVTVAVMVHGASGVGAVTGRAGRLEAGRGLLGRTGVVRVARSGITGGRETGGRAGRWGVPRVLLGRGRPHGWATGTADLRGSCPVTRTSSTGSSRSSNTRWTWEGDQQEMSGIWGRGQGGMREKEGWRKGGGRTTGAGRAGKAALAWVVVSGAGRSSCPHWNGT